MGVGPPRAGPPTTRKDLSVNPPLEPPPAAQSVERRLARIARTLPADPDYAIRAASALAADLAGLEAQAAALRALAVWRAVRTGTRQAALAAALGVSAAAVNQLVAAVDAALAGSGVGPRAVWIAAYAAANPAITEGVNP